MTLHNIKNTVAEYARKNGINIAVSQEMPTGYETAFGTFDVEVQTLFINLPLLQNANDWEVTFYLYHELRHALQYNKREMFGKQIRQSIDYVILYDGTCYKLTNGKWTQCVLTGEIDFEQAYLSLAYELDANKYAFRTTAKLYPQSKRQIRQLYKFALPKNRVSFAKQKTIFAQIDKTLTNNLDK